MYMKIACGESFAPHSSILSSLEVIARAIDKNLILPFFLLSYFAFRIADGIRSYKFCVQIIPTKIANIGPAKIA